MIYLQIYDRSKGLFLAKGHLSPNADFVLKELQDSTYYFFNVAPQWQSFNNGNWADVEKAVRAYASLHRADLRVFTGTYGSFRLGSSQQPWFMSKVRGRDLIPVPLYFWKIVEDASSNRAIAFVGVNHPFESAPVSLCPQDEADLCEKQGWVFPNRHNTHQGHLYCCTFQSLAENIPWTKHLLLNGRPRILSNF